MPVQRVIDGKVPIKIWTADVDEAAVADLHAAVPVVCEFVELCADAARSSSSLCWQLGEKNITHWHGVEEGFSGRRPLPKRKT